MSRWNKILHVAHCCYTWSITSYNRIIVAPNWQNPGHPCREDIAARRKEGLYVKLSIAGDIEGYLKAYQARYNLLITRSSVSIFHSHSSLSIIAGIH